VIDPSITDATFGEAFLGGKSVRTARRVILEDRIPYQKVRGHWLVKQSDAETWRESRMQKPELTLKSMVAGITARVRREREKSSGVRLDEGFQPELKRKVGGTADTAH